MVTTPAAQSTGILQLMHLPNHKSPHLEYCLLGDGEGGRELLEIRAC